jgi:hypothetical protein
MQPERCKARSSSYSLSYLGVLQARSWVSSEIRQAKIQSKTKTSLCKLPSLKGSKSNEASPEPSHNDTCGKTAVAGVRACS